MRNARDREWEQEAAEEMLEVWDALDSEYLDAAEEAEAAGYIVSEQVIIEDMVLPKPGTVKVYKNTNPCCGHGCATPFEGECGSCSPDGGPVLVEERPMNEAEFAAWARAEKKERQDG